jgi:hypothetical protein
MPTEARLKYLAKQAAKQADRLSDADRQSEYEKVMGQFTELGLGADPDVAKFDELMSAWVKDAQPRRGTIPVTSAQRMIIYTFGISRKHTGVMFKSVAEESGQTESAQTVDDETEAPQLVPNSESQTENKKKITATKQTAPIVSAVSRPRHARPVSAAKNRPMNKPKATSA